MRMTEPTPNESEILGEYAPTRARAMGVVDRCLAGLSVFLEGLTAALDVDAEF